MKVNSGCTEKVPLPINPTGMVYPTPKLNPVPDEKYQNDIKNFIRVLISPGLMAGKLAIRKVDDFKSP